jgi:peroxiredoxin Q/BCP
MTDAAAPTMPEAGDPAPGFSLPDDTGTMRSLADARGRWLVLFFYPKDDTPGCTTEACEFRDALADFSHHGAEVWGISKLDSESKARFKQKFALTFPLLADEDHAVSQAYGTWVEKMQYGRATMGVRRSTFLVDPDGRIAHVWPTVTPEGHAAEVHAELERLQAAPVLS